MRVMPTNVQHIATSLDVGGAQAMLLKLVNADRHPSSVRHSIVSLIAASEFAGRDDAPRCPVYSLDMRRALPGPRSLTKLLRITGCQQPDLIQGWMYHGNIAASFARYGQARPTPVVWNVRHSLADLKVESRATRALLALSARVSRRTSAIIYNSQTAARQHEAIGFDPARSTYIPNGFDSRLYRPAPDRRTALRAMFGIGDAALVVAMVARFHPMKDHAMLVEAVGRARAAGHDLHLLLVGTGIDSPPPELARSIAATLPTDRVTLVGERHDVAQWLPGVDIVALSSAWGEAFPNILGEAMMCGLPCVTTDVGDGAAILGESGLVVPPRDAVAMADALSVLAVEGTEGRANRGAAARTRAVEHYELDHVARLYDRLYAQLLKGAPAHLDRPAHRDAASEARHA